MKIVVAAFLSLCLLIAGTASSLAVTPVTPGATDSSPPMEQGPVPPADVGPPPVGSESSGPGMTELAIGAVIVTGAFIGAAATEGTLAAGLTAAAAILLIYSVLP